MAATPPESALALLQRSFNRPLRDLASFGSPGFEGIYSPLYDEAEVKRYMSSYYESLEGARGQDEKLDLNSYYLSLLRESLQRTGQIDELPRVRSVLEIGCGFGSATVPILELFPGAAVVASEFSLSMLQLLKSKLAGRAAEGRCAFLQLNAEDMDFKPGTFDLVIGAAVLHHLFHPEKVLQSCAKILKPGGRAIFFEPFESGFDVVGLIYEDTCRDPRSWLMGSRTRLYFKNCVHYWRQMRSEDKRGAFFVGADDKWLFTPAFFEDQRRSGGFAGCQMYAIDKSSRPFEALIKTHLKGNNVRTPPAWFWAIVDRYENAFSRDLKQTLFTEGCIILQK